jgi:hypothetical protein
MKTSKNETLRLALYKFNYFQFRSNYERIDFSAPKGVCIMVYVITS